MSPWLGAVSLLLCSNTDVDSRVWSLFFSSFPMAHVHRRVSTQPLWLTGPCEYDFFLTTHTFIIWNTLSSRIKFLLSITVWISRIICFEHTLCHTKFYAILLVLVYIFILAKLFINSPRGVAIIFFPLNLYCVTQCLKHYRCSINKNKLGWEVRKLSKRYWSHSEKAAEILQTMEHLNLILKN